MSLLTLIRKRHPGNLATAIPAIPATQEGQATGTVARIATVAVATATYLLLRKQRTTDATLTPDAEAAIRAWLATIEETDPEAIAEVLDRCQVDTNARAFFVGQARNVPLLEQAPVCCGDCLNFAPDTVNPKAGLGACSAPGEQSKGLHFPFTIKLCCPPASERLLRAEPFSGRPFTLKPCRAFEGRSVET